MNPLRDMHIKPKLTAILVFTGVVPLLLVGMFMGGEATDALLSEAFDKLHTVQEIRKNQISGAVNERLGHLKVLAGRREVHDLARDLAGHEHVSRGALLAPFQADTAEYRDLVRPANRPLREALDTYNFHDLLLVSPLTGNVLYSVLGGRDLGANLAHGSLKDSGAALAWRGVVRTGGFQATDFAPYAAEQGAERAFLGYPVNDEAGTLTCVLVVSVTPEFVNRIMDSRQGLGASGEAYLISYDEHSDVYEFRSDLKTLGGGTYVVGAPFKPMDYWRDAVRTPEGGSALYVDSAGHDVLVAYDSMGFKGLNWYLISKIDKAEVTSAVAHMARMSLLVAGGLVLSIGLGAFFFAAGFSRPILEGADFAKAVAGGEYGGSLEDKRGDELGVLASALNGMSASLGRTSWMQRGKEGLDDAMRGEHSPVEMARRVVAHLARHMSAQLGAVYFHRDGLLHLKAGYAFTDRTGDYTTVKVGEGMVGQAAAEREMLAYSKMDGSLPVVDYGAGVDVPRHFLLVPLVFEDELLGVVLLGAHKPFSEVDREFVRSNAPNIGVMLNVSRSRRTIQKLLDEATEQQEKLAASNQELERQAVALKESEAELQAQQEELRVTNEELEEQTNALKESQAELQAQQEELRVTNEELEERTEALEQQREFIKRKNADLVKARNSLKRQAEELALASRYKSEFLANMSHELRTPLNSILILSQLFAGNRDGNLSAKQVESAKAIHSSGADLLALIDQILDLSKIEAGRVELVLEEVPLRVVVEDLDRVFRDVAASKGVELRTEIAPGLEETITTDSQRLQQVLRNLLTNAFKFTPKGAVTLGIDRPREDYVPEGGAGAEAYVAFSVTDQGIGIPKDKQAAIFEAFRQADGGTSRKYGGTGLGLSISRELSRLLGGAIHLESEEGNGSTFTVVVPVRHTGEAAPEPLASAASAAVRDEAAPAPEAAQTAPAAEAPAEAAAAAPSAPAPAPVPVPVPVPVPELPDPDNLVKDDRHDLQQGDKVLLIIEDDRQFAQIMRDFGRERGYKCLIAHEGETGLHFADYYKPSAIVLDIGLPGIDGWSVMERLKSDSDLRHIPVHFMSASDSSLDAMRMGAVGFLSKPVSIEQVDQAFARIESIVSRPVRRLLVVEDDPIQRDGIRQLIGNGDVETVTVGTGAAAFDELKKGGYECMVLDLGLQDMSGFDLLEKISTSDECSMVPVIIYTGRDLTREENDKLRAYTESIIIKGAKSPERLLEETGLFLHRVEADMPRDKRKMLKMVHNHREGVLRGKRVMIVDDDMRNVFALTSILEDKEVEVTVARNGRECVDKLGDGETADLVLMDIMMPVMDGYEAMRAIRGELGMKKLPVIALTAKAMKGDRSKCIEAGANDYMAKPVDTDKLLSMLKVWLYS